MEDIELATATPLVTGSNERVHPPVFPTGVVAKTRDRLLGVISSLEGLTAREKDQALQIRILQLREQVEQNRFYITVVGQFKRGKASFLNALLGAEVLPALTSIVTILQYGDCPGAEVIYQTGSRTPIAVRDLAEYVTDESNPKNVKKVSYAVVTYPSAYMRGGVTLLDTPDIESAYTRHTNDTYEFLPQADAAIFISSPEPTIPNAEIERLCDLAMQVRKVFVVLDKTDSRSADQFQGTVNLTRGLLPESVSSVLDSILVVSSGHALKAIREGNAELLNESGFTEVERKLSQFLSSKNNGVFYASIAGRTRQLIVDLKLSYEIQIRAARMPLDDLHKKLAKLDRHLARAQKEKKDSQILLQNNLEWLSHLIETEAAYFAETRIKPLQAEVRRHLKIYGKLDRKDLVAEMDRFLRERIERLFDEWRAQFEADAAEHLRQASARFAQRVNQLVVGMRKTAGSLFGFSVQAFDVTEELADLESCGYFTDPVLDSGLGKAPLPLPHGLFKLYLLRTLLRKTECELDRNATRVAFEYKKQLDKSINRFLNLTTTKFDESANGIRRAVTSIMTLQKEGSAAIAAQLDQCHTAIHQLEDSENEMATLSFKY